jgi:hypothetical protein
LTVHLRAHGLTDAETEQLLRLGSGSPSHFLSTGSSSQRDSRRYRGTGSSTSSPIPAIGPSMLANTPTRPSHCARSRPLVPSFRRRSRCRVRTTSSGWRDQSPPAKHVVGRWAPGRRSD